MIFLSAADTEQVFDWASAIRWVREAYERGKAGPSVPGRLIASQASAWIRCMPALPDSGRYMGTKQISRTREGKLTYVITLFSRDTGTLDFLIDAVTITAMRTAATSAAALGALATPGPVRLAVLGSGLEATHHVEAFAQVRPIESLAVYSPTADKRERFAAEMGRLASGRSNACASGAEAVAGATVVLAAARSRGEVPILHGDWLAPGAVVLSIGSTTPAQREVDASVIAAADVIVADVPHELSDDTGDMIAARQSGISFSGKLHSLHDLLQGRIPRELLRADRWRLFKSVGSALQDIVVAEYLATAAVSRGLGRHLDLDMRLKQSIGKNA